MAYGDLTHAAFKRAKKTFLRRPPLRRRQAARRTFVRYAVGLGLFLRLRSARFFAFVFGCPSPRGTARAPTLSHI